MTNQISSNFKCGSNFRIGHFCVIEDDVEVGDNVTIGNYTIILKGTRVGNNTEIGNYCEIGEKLVIGNNVILQGRIRTGSKCLIEDDVTVKYGSILTSNAALRKGCFLGPNVITLGSTHQRVTVHGTDIGERTYVGAGSKIAGGIKIAADVVIGAMSYVNKEITAKGTYVGVPAKELRK